jgi:redox-sensitive bicupin YhaK (pirin superfamily)
VRPHPHIGLATVTYLFEGAMMHRDSLGVVQQIEPGAINWMTAGRGIVHSSASPDSLRGSTYVNHGLQLWAALPREGRGGALVCPHAGGDIPELVVDGATVRVLIGEAFGVQVAGGHLLAHAVPGRAVARGRDAAAALPWRRAAVYAVDGAWWWMAARRPRRPWRC